MYSQELVTSQGMENPTSPIPRELTGREPTMLQIAGLGETCVMFLTLLVANSTATTNQVTPDYLTPLLYFMSGVATIILAEGLLGWWNRRRVRPRILMEPEMSPSPPSSSSLLMASLRFRIGNNSPLLDAKCVVTVMLPKLVVDGKLTELLTPDFISQTVPWYLGDKKESEIADLYPFPESLMVILAFFARNDYAFTMNFLNGENIDSWGNASDLMFSKSHTNVIPTRDLQIILIVAMRGKTTSDEPIRRRFVLLLTIPDFANIKGCDFTKATFIDLHRKESENLRAFLLSQGYDVDAKWTIVPSFDRKAT